MKRLFILILLSYFYSLSAYQLATGWLNTPGRYSIFRTDTLLNLSTTQSFDFSACIDSMNTKRVSNLPVLVSTNTQNNSALCKVRYGAITDSNGYNLKNVYGLCVRYNNGKYTDFVISLNDSANMPWGTGINQMDINTTFRHELGHALGLEHSKDTNALMFANEKPLTTFNNPITYLMSDDLNGLKNVYEKPIISITSPDTSMIFVGDTKKFQIRPPKLLEVNGTMPASIKIHGFLTRYFSNGAVVSVSTINPMLDLSDDTLSLVLANDTTYTFKLVANSKFTSLDLGVRVFNQRIGKDYSWYGHRDINAPFGEINFKVTPKQTTSHDCTAGQRATTIVVKAKTTEFDGITDYPVDRVEFFVKKESESDYSPIDSPVNANGVNPKYYWTEWDGFLI